MIAQALNWLLKGARLVVLPLQRCMSLLRRDPRLTAVLPQSGAPLHWTLLVRPIQTREPLPRAWVEQAWSEPMASSLLRQGWRPPLGRRELEPAGQSIPSRWKQLVLPDPDIWACCWSLRPSSGLSKTGWLSAGGNQPHRRLRGAASGVGACPPADLESEVDGDSAASSRRSAQAEASTDSHQWPARAIRL